MAATGVLHQERLNCRQAIGPVLVHMEILRPQAHPECQLEERVAMAVEQRQEEAPADAEEIRGEEVERAERESVRERLARTHLRRRTLRHHKVVALIEAEAVDRIHRRALLHRRRARRQVVVETHPGRAVEVVEGEIDSVATSES